MSTTTLLVHSNKSIPGAVASLAIPWGEHRGDEDLLQGAYHLVWSRDLVQHGGGLLAAGAKKDAHRLLEYLQSTQEADGHWPQNMWVSGSAFWDGIQLDQAAQPILLADLALREGAFQAGDRERFWSMVRRAAGYIVRNGASTEQDRWEEQTGYNSYTLGVTIAALRTAAGWADTADERSLGDYLRETAEIWNSLLEGWLYVRDTDLSRRLGIEGYYAAVLPPAAVEPPVPGQESAILRDPNVRQRDLPPSEIVSADALALVRYGLRAADDPRIRNTVKAIDAVLKLQTPAGPVWHRYNGDEFGETADGAAYGTVGKGIGRAWPLLIGERAHYELARGDRQAAAALARSMANFACETGLISEQVWDAPDIPEQGLFFGKPTGSVMPLLWAHSEYVKLRRSLVEGRIFDRPRGKRPDQAISSETSSYTLWRLDHACHRIRSGTNLRIELPADAEVAWEIEGIDSTAPLTDRRHSGQRVIDLATMALPPGATVRLTVTCSDKTRRRRTEKHVVRVTDDPADVGSMSARSS